jgi:hypothetical protein
VYLEKWSNSVLPFHIFHWTVHKNPPTLEKILLSAKHVASVDKNVTNILDEDGLFDKFIHVANISKTRMYGWNTKPPFERWSEIFEFVRSECISLRKNIIFLIIL